MMSTYPFCPVVFLLLSLLCESPVVEENWRRYIGTEAGFRASATPLIAVDAQDTEVHLRSTVFVCHDVRPNLCIRAMALTKATLLVYLPGRMTANMFSESVRHTG